MELFVSAYVEQLDEFHGHYGQCTCRQLVDGAQPRPTHGNDAAAAAHDELFHDDDDVSDLHVHGAVQPTPSKPTDKTAHCG